MEMGVHLTMGTQTQGLSLEILRPTQDQGLHTGISPDNGSCVGAEEQGFLFFKVCIKYELIITYI